MRLVNTSNNTLLVGSNVIANFTNNNGQLKINFVSGNGTIVTHALISEIVESILYKSNSQDLPSSIGLTYSFNDGQGAANSVVSSDITMNITRVDHAPVNTVPTTQSLNENATLVFSSANSNSIRVSDIDADGGLGGAGGTETVTLTVNHGVLSLSTTNGLTGIVGNSTNSLSFTGTISDLNTALNGLTYKPNINYFEYNSTINCSLMFSGISSRPGTFRNLPDLASPSHSSHGYLL